MTHARGESAAPLAEGDASGPAQPAPRRSPGGAIDFTTWQLLQALYADYVAVLDHGELQRWPEFFVEDGVYRLQSRENFDRGLPLATMAFESRGMLKDRVCGAAETIFHDPYYQRHIVGAPRVLEVHDAVIRSEANYVVVRTKRDAMP